MNGVNYLDEYQDAVLAELKTIPWAMTVGMYPELPDNFITPAVFLDVSRWDRSEVMIGGNVTVDLSCMLYVVRAYQTDEETIPDEGSAAENRTETRVRNAALKMSDWVHGRQFGSTTAPALFESADPMVWQDGDNCKNHAIWGVAYSQLLAVGEDFFEEPDAPLLKSFWLGIFPEVGAAHKDDYIQLLRDKGG
ncbi:hypothetical protein RVW00_000764 [Enterobacter bugandensis]|nr:hypothetical protein [Enterobacter bugandensis]